MSGLQKRDVRRTFFIAGTFWTVFAVIAIAWTYGREEEQVNRLALKEARANFNKDLAFRRWATGHGGVYVEPDARTPPNPYLAHLPRRDVVTTDGHRLTLMNPAYMMRQMTKEFEQNYGIKGSITGLVQLNPINAPDPWERRVLEDFTRAPDEAAEVHELRQIGGAPYLRMMRPMFMTEGCVKCHGHLGFKDGDLRGGISVSVPLTAYLEDAHSQGRMAGWLFGGFWLFGVFGLIGYARRRRSQVDEMTGAQEVIRQSEERFALSVKGSSAGMWDWIDIENDVVWWSPRLYALLKVDPAQVPTASFAYFSTLLHPDDVRGTQRAVEAHLVDRVPFDVEYRVRTGTGEYRWFQGRGQALWDPSGRPTRMSGSIQDIDDRKRLERQLRSKSAQLSTVNHELTRKNQELEDIIYVTSHDLRSPLINIHGFGDELLEHGQTLAELLAPLQLPSDCKDAIQTLLKTEIPDAMSYITKSSRRMDELLSGLIHVSRLGRVHMRFERLDMNLLLNTVLATMKFRIKSGDVVVNCGRLPACEGDRALLTQVFSNLIDNALKYRDPERPLVLEISGRLDGRMSAYTISDTGIGIDSRYNTKVFQMFHRLGDKPSEGGEGLGLAVVRRAVERHGGLVRVEGVVGEGSTFHIQIPTHHPISTEPTPTE